MKLFFAALSLCFLCITRDIHAQEITGEERIMIDALLDSAGTYRLKDPARTLQFANQIISRIPVKGNETIHITAYLHIANSQKMLGREEEALDYCRRAIKYSHQLDDPIFLIRSYFMLGSVFDEYEEHDSSLIYHQKVIDLHRPGINPYFVSCSYITIGDSYEDIGNIQKAEEYYLKGYRFAAEDEYAKIFALASLIGFYVLNDNLKYLPYLDTLAETDFYKKASATSFLAHFESFLLLDQSSNEKKEKTLREVYDYALKHTAPVNQVGYGLKLYAHLDEMHKYDEARVLLLELLQKSKDVQNGRHITDITHALYDNSKSRGDLLGALKYLERYGELRDSLLSEENMKVMSELNVKFETAQKDNEIERQKIRLEQEQRNRNFLTALTLLVIALAATVFIYFRNRARSAQRITAQQKVIHEQKTERMQKEKEVAELTASLETQEKERNRIARDLHDGLGSMMSGISSQIEYLRAQPAIEQASRSHLAQLRDMVKDATSELRRTSYELMPAKLLRQGLEPAIRDLCLNQLVKNGIEPTMEINADLTTLNPDEQLTLYRIIQELLNNIVKHADAKNVMIQFTKFDDEISLVVEDDGKGFDVASRKLDGGLGLGSLGSRVNLLKGFLDIASMPGEGTTVTVNFSMEHRA